MNHLRGTYKNSMFLNELKVSLVTPVRKADDNKQVTNNRPISALTCFPKILEKEMYQRLLNCK